MGIGEIIKALGERVFSIFKFGAASLVSRVLGAFGLTLISLKALLPDLKGFVQQYFNAIPPEGAKWISALGVDVFIVAVISALIIKISTKVILAPKSAAPGGTP